MWYQPIITWEFWAALTPNYFWRMPALLPSFCNSLGTNNSEGGSRMAHLFAAQVSVHVLLCATVMIMKKNSKHMAAPTPNELNFFLFVYTALALWTATARVCDLCDAGFAAVLLLMSLMATIARIPCFTASSKQISVGPLTLENSGLSPPDCLEKSNDNKMKSSCGSSNCH